MPPRIPEEVRALIVDLLKKSLRGVEVQRALLEEHQLTVSLNVITKEAYRLGIELKGGPRAGMPGVGRPKSEGPAKRWSPNRKKALELKQQGFTRKQIAEKLGISPQAVSQFLSSDEGK